MKRGITVLIALSALAVAAYFTASEWAIRRETITFYDASRDNRPVPVQIAVRRDKEMQANAGMITLPVAVINHGNTVKNTEYGFLANIFAARGYMVVSPQHDLPTDPPMATKPGELYVDRVRQILRGVANIHHAMQELKKVQPNADYAKVTMVGDSEAPNIAMYFAKQYPEEVKKVITLDDMLVPFTAGKFKILSFRSRDPQSKTDPGVLPSDEEMEKAGIQVVKTEFQHNDMSGRGSEASKKSVQDMLDKFLETTDSELALRDTKALQPVHFATNREIVEKPTLELSAITDGRSEKLKYGLAVVSVPKNHQIGKVERPKFKYLTWKFEAERDEDHFRLKLLKLMGRDSFVTDLREGADSVLLFIHGYNVPFQDAIFKAAQIAYDANFAGSTLVFSWPSAGDWKKYDYDRESAEYSIGDLLQILRLLNGEIGQKRLYIVAHSLGNHVLVGALQQAALSKVTLNISELVLAAPDVDKHVFIKKANDIRTIAKNMTMYVSSADKALLVSDKKSWGIRVGYVGDTGPNLVEGIETIDVTAVGDDMFSLDHSTFSNSRAVLDDLGRIISSSEHLRPEVRTPTLKLMPNKEQLKYWLYPH